MNLKSRIKHEIKCYKDLMKVIPAGVFTLYVVGVCFMNLLANRELFNYGWIALDCGFALSWIAFLAQDMLTRRFGAKASIEISITSEVINLAMCGLLFLIMQIPGNWSAFYDSGEVIVNEALDATFAGTWYVVIGSCIAFLVSSIVNSLLNQAIGRVANKGTFSHFALRSYTSTAIGQFVDNLLFALIVSHVFFGWTMIQVIMCSIVGALFELAMEIVFSPIGYRVCKKWEKDGIGNEYLKEV